MHKGFSKRRMQTAISCKQLDFDWYRSLQKSKARDSKTAETGASITGQQSSETDIIDRLFVPLAYQPFCWFQSGQKKWELRRFGRQYTPKNVRVGRRVELRKGYRGPDAMWGKILEVIQAKNVEDFFNKVPFRDVIPVANSREDAVRIATNILNVDSDTPLLGFAVDTF